MRFTLDTSRLNCLVVAAAEELRQFDERKPRAAWAPRKDHDGQVPGRRLGQCLPGEVQDGAELAAHDPTASCIRPGIDQPAWPSPRAP